MTKWTPPRETGLHGDRYVEDDLDAFIDNDLGTGARTRPGVYAVKLSTPDDYDTALEYWHAYYDTDPPDWLREAYKANVAVYVGAAKNVHQRLHTRITYANRSTAIARVYPFHSLFNVWWFNDVERAFEREKGVAMELRNKYPGLYVHCR